VVDEGSEVTSSSEAAYECSMKEAELVMDMVATGPFRLEDQRVRGRGESWYRGWRWSRWEV
jgi:hypothetical protein